MQPPFIANTGLKPQPVSVSQLQAGNFSTGILHTFPFSKIIVKPTHIEKKTSQIKWII